ncbi:hypothetical protein [Aquaticitalea lipolytica]|uniref:hypothetical protein n=1 Tax=Aquaticitalea lipolytica TaxID=1247562 RepID=UPI0024B8B325|nr:hypothetical protein [Aquaticitalea lipolytica]
MSKENPFKKIGNPPVEAPIHLKKKVMDGVESIKLIQEVSSLFTFNYASVLSGILKKNKKNNSNNKD